MGGNVWKGPVARAARSEQDQAPTIEKTTALTAFTVTSLFEDREGNLWAGTVQTD